MKATDTTTAYGVRTEDGTVLPRPDRPSALTTLRGIRHRGGQATLVTQQVTVTPWQDVDVPAPVVNCSCRPGSWHGSCDCGCRNDDSVCRAAGCCGRTAGDRPEGVTG